MSSFTTSTCATGSTGECVPDGLVFDSSGNLWVGDGGNARVLEYAGPAPTPPWHLIVIIIIVAAVILISLGVLVRNRKSDSMPKMSNAEQESNAKV